MGVREKDWEIKKVGLVGEKWLGGLELKDQEPIRKEKKGGGENKGTGVLLEIRNKCIEVGVGAGEVAGAAGAHQAL